MNFQKIIAQAYDLIYKEKDYTQESQFVDKIIKKYHKGKAKTLLDAGCGSGNHSFIFAKMGYQVTGFDLSKSMIEIAQNKADKASDIKFLTGDLRAFDFKKKFDVCVSMFAVLGYVTKNSEILKTFINIRKHLKTGGIFIFDVWNGLGVMTNPPESREKVFQDSKIKVLRQAKPNLIAQDHICQVFYDLQILDKNSGKTHKTKEKHTVRFYFPQEIMLMLEISGFQVLKICKAFDINKPADQNAWHMSVVAKAR